MKVTMVAIAPKALRFARLAAAGRAEASRLDLASAAGGQGMLGSPSRYVEISPATAELCVALFSSLLDDGKRFEGEEWDGNDYEFLVAVRDSLQQQLARPVHGHAD